MTIETRITTEAELLERGFEYVRPYLTPRDLYQIYETSTDRVIVEEASEGNKFWVIQNDRRGDIK